MKKFLLVVVGAGALVLLSSASAFGGFFDFIGDAAGAVSEATWKVALIKMIERTLPSLILLTSIVGSIVSMTTAAYLAMRLHESAKSVLKDDKVTVGEWIILIGLSTITLPVVIGLLWFGFFLAQASHVGLTELME